MGFKNKGVSLKVDLDFFNKTFEPARRRMQEMLGTKVTQKQLTRMISKSGIRFEPKLIKFLKNGTKRNTRNKK